jgi:mannitol-1-phosphate/altronate dehydrogenase
LIHIPIFALRKNKASGPIVEKTADLAIVSCSFAQQFSTATRFCTSFVDKIVRKAGDTN